MLRKDPEVQNKSKQERNTKGDPFQFYHWNILTNDARCNLSICPIFLGVSCDRYLLNQGCGERASSPQIRPCSRPAMLNSSFLDKCSTIPAPNAPPIRFTIDPNLSLFKRNCCWSPVEELHSNLYLSFGLKAPQPTYRIQSVTTILLKYSTGTSTVLRRIGTATRAPPGPAPPLTVSVVTLQKGNTGKKWVSVLLCCSIMWICICTTFFKFLYLTTSAV